MLVTRHQIQIMDDFETDHYIQIDFQGDYSPLWRLIEHTCMARLVKWPGFVLENTEDLSETDRNYIK